MYSLKNSHTKAASVLPIFSFKNFVKWCAKSVLWEEKKNIHMQINIAYSETQH